ncbi:MAG TPA: HlyD family efflux transporter periplasmic adaptor subunit [Ruminiclostridium sp.]
MKKKVFIGISVATLIIILIVVGIVKNSVTAGTGAVFSVKASEITKGDITSYLSANGTVAEIEKSEIFIDIPLKVTKVHVKQNDVVKKGQKLADFDFDAMNLQLEQAKLQLRTQELTLEKLRLIDSTISVTAGQNSLKVAQNSIAAAQRSYDVALKNLNDSTALYAVDAISKSELDKAESSLKDAESSLINAKLSLESQKDSISATSKSNNQSASSKQIDIQSQEVAIENSNLTIKDLDSKIKKYTGAMYSGMDGVASQVNVSDGSFTPSGQPTFVVVNPSKLEVKLNINEYNAKQMKVGQKVEITGDSIPETDKITGKVRSVSPVASKNVTSTGSSETVIEVLVDIDNITPSIKPGITVNCDIKTVEIKNILTVELDMLSSDKDGNNFVFVLSSDKKTMQKKKIEIGTNSDMKAELKSGDLKEGDLVVMIPLSSYKDGSRIKLITDQK